MKTATDPRHLHRQKIVQKLFAWQELPSNEHQSIQTIIDNLSTINKTIEKYAPEWAIDKIYPADLAILRLALYELSLVKTEPVKVIIDEAVELAKEFGNETSPGFINGVLGTYLKNESV